MAALGDALAGGAPILPITDDPGQAEHAAALQRADLPEGTAVVIRTSGSSGVPKAVALSAAALRASAEATHERLGGPGQWLVTLPAQLISGLQMLVRSAHAGTQPVFFDGHFEPEALLAAAERMEGERRYVSLVPVQFMRLLDLAERDAAAAETLRRFDAVLVGGQAITLEMRRRAYALEIELRRSYGMTETAGGCVYDGVEIGDTLVRIRGGEVQLAGASLALGYVGDAALTNDCFITEADGTRWYRTGDAGELLGGMLTVTGRLDRVIISGGINVALDEVERVVRELPGWADACALGTADPVWGERVHLVRTTSTDTSDTSFADASAAVRAALGVAAEPTGETVVDAIPRLAGEKPDRAALAALCGTAAPDAGAPAQKTDDTKETA
nr:AMP-binding protein [Leucobacter exalbidus]